MRLLHVGSGFRPLRRGGLVAYVEDLTQHQARSGHEVAYFFSGRQFPFVPGPRLKRWHAGGVQMLEVVSSPLYDHGRQPELELSEPRTERMLARLITELRPEVMHVHELAGLPSSVLEVAHQARVPTVVTLQDYFPLCSTFKLFDATGQVCLRHEVGEDCVATTAAEPHDPALLFDATLRYQLLRLPRFRNLEPERRERLLDLIAVPLARWGARVRRRGQGSDPPTAAAFQRRREVNVRRLSAAGRLIAMSHRVAEIYELLGVAPERLQTLHLTLTHIERLRPRLAAGTSPVTFATLGGLESEAKGSEVLLGALRSLAPQARDGRLRMLVFGWARDETKAELASLPGVELRGPYVPEALDDLLDEVDVGIVPSVWEEAYGYAGMEFLAKGVPVIANAIGGLVDYVREGETGWLNRSCTAEELERIMREICDRPQRVADLNAKLRADRESIVKPMARHLEEMDHIYSQLVA